MSTKYRTKPKEFYALHDGATGKSVIQEVGSTSFQTGVDTVEFLQHHEPVPEAAPRAVSAGGASGPVRRGRGPNKPKPVAIPAASNGNHNHGRNDVRQEESPAAEHVPEHALAGSAAE